MNYAAIYTNLIKRSMGRELKGYSEFHHILPTSINKSDEIENLAHLTVREHFLAHLLLIKMYPDQRCLVFAAHMMTIGVNRNRKGIKKPQWLRKRHSAATSAEKRGNTYMVGKTHSAESRAKMSAAALARPYIKRHPLTDDVKAKISKSNLGVKKALDHCGSMSKAGQKRAKALPPYSDGTIRVPGVIERPNGMFVARARINGKRKYLGFFPNAKLAVEAVMPFLT